MAFDNRSFEGIYSGCNCGIVFRGNGVGIKEAAAVVELDVAGWRKLPEGIVDLRRDSSCGEGFGERVLPEVAHEAAVGALAVGEEDGGDGNDLVRSRVLVFEVKSVGALRVECVSLRSLGDDPVVARG